MKTNRAIRPGNVVDVDAQSFLTAKTTIIDEAEKGAISRVLDGAQHGLHLLRVQGPNNPFSFWFPLHPLQEGHGHPSVIAKPSGETSERSQTPIVGGGCEGFLACKECLENVSGQCSDWFLAYRGYERREIFGVTLAGLRANDDPRVAQRDKLK